MFLREFFKLPNKLIVEGGNVSSQSPGWQGAADQEAEEIDLKIHNRDFMVRQLQELLTAQNEDFKNAYGRHIWDPKLLKSGKMFSGSSLQFFDIKSVSTQDFLDKLKKVKVGDIDTQVDQVIGKELTEWLKSIIGKKIGNGTFLGFNSSLSSIWRLDDPPVRVQIDYELGPYDPKTNAPTEWFAYSHSSHYDDMAAGIKGVFHKYINRALTQSQQSTKYVARVLKKGVKIADEPITDGDYSFAVTSSQGGGMSKKYVPYIDPATGQPMEKDGIPVMQQLDPKDREYIQDLDQQFSITFGRKRTPADKNLQGSFVGTIQLMNKYFTPEQNENVAKAFLDILFGRGAQMITKDDPERDRDIKFAAVDAMLLGAQGQSPLKVSDAKSLRQEAVNMATEYANQFLSKKATKSEVTEGLVEAGAPNYARQGIKHIYNRLPDGRVSTAEMKNAEFSELAKEIADNGGNLDNVQIDLKVDGAGIRFGKDSQGEPFFMTSRVTEPLYKKDVGFFTRYGEQQGQSPEQLARTKNYDNALALITGSKFIQALPPDTIVQAEMMYNPMAEKTKDGLKFVNIAYDPSKLGRDMTLVPFAVKQFSTGEPHPASDKIKQKLVSLSDPKIKLITTKLEHQGINVSDIIAPVLNLDPKKKENKEAFDQAKKQLSDLIINSPNLKGKAVLGSNLEGIVVKMPSGTMFKVTSPLMKTAMAAKSAPAAKRQGPLKTAVVAVGSFAGHRGHEKLFQYTLSRAEELGADPYLFIGNAVGADDPIPPEIKVQTWHKLYPAYAKNISTVMQGGTLIQKLKHELINPAPGKPPKYDNIIITVGEDRKDLPLPAALMKAVNKFPGYEHVKVTLETIPRTSESMSFTKLRNVLKDPNATPEQQYALWSQGFNEKRLGRQWILNLINIAKKGMGLNSPKDTQMKEAVKSSEFCEICRQSPCKCTSIIEEAVEKYNRRERLVERALLSEGPSLETTIRAIVNDVGEPVLQLYATLSNMAQKFYDNNGSLNGFGMISGNTASRWFSTFYFNRLGKELHHLVGYAPKQTKQLKEFLASMPENFWEVAGYLPEILIQVGENLKSAELVRVSLKWKDARKKFKDLYDRLKDLEDNDKEDQKSAPKPQKSDAVGKQSSQVEEIVAGVLRSLPAKVAGEIRAAIARSDNKLLALQKELTKRNIKLSESIVRKYFKKI